MRRRQVTNNFAPQVATAAPPSPVAGRPSPFSSCPATSVSDPVQLFSEDEEDDLEMPTEIPTEPGMQGRAVFTYWDYTSFKEWWQCKSEGWTIVSMCSHGAAILVVAEKSRN